MFSDKDIRAIKARGADETTILKQIENFRKGFPFLKLIRPATIDDGIRKITDREITELSAYYDNCRSRGIKSLKFVPASGAASRMFKYLFETKEKLDKGIPEQEVMSGDLNLFLSGLRKFAFYDDLKVAIKQGQSQARQTLQAESNLHAGQTANTGESSTSELNKSQPGTSESTTVKSPDEFSTREILNYLLTHKGLNYGNLPKALLYFHKYGDSLARTPFAEHAVEGAMYAWNNDGTVNIHFTVSPEHTNLFEAHLHEIRADWEDFFNVSYDISFSQQKASTDTIAVTPDNEPFRNDDGSLLFRPGGHGALLANLNDLDADLVFIKNIDNVVPDRLKPATTKYKKTLAGLLLKLQQNIFNYQKIFDTHHYYALDSVFLAEAANFLENVLNVKPPENQYYTEKEELYHYLKSKFDRPVRVCGMVRNQGEPGGGPFWAKNSDYSVSLQIVESSQVDLDDPDQKEIMQKSTHFNPVDLVCAFKNYKGEKYDLFNFLDPQTGFISTKSKDGKSLKAQELPGLWNGAMANWNTLFVEVPVETFNPVKTVNDLLRKEHQTGKEFGITN